MFELAALLIKTRLDFKTSPADAPPPGIVAIPVQMRFVHAIVPATVRPPANVLVWVSASPSQLSVSAVADDVELLLGILVSQKFTLASCALAVSSCSICRLATLRASGLFLISSVFDPPTTSLKTFRVSSAALPVRMFAMLAFTAAMPD